MVTVSNPRFFVTFLTLLNSSLAFAQSPALVRDSTIATVGTFQGSVPAHVTPVVPSHNLTIVILADSLTTADATRLRREIAATFTTAFLNSHRLQLVNLSGLAGDFSTPLTSASQLQAALKQINPGVKATSPLSLIETLGAIPANLPSNWAHTVIAGRLPVFAKDETFVAAWLSEVYRKQRVRLSFWSLDGAAPTWAQSVAAGAMGTVATSGFNALLPMLNDNSAYAEVSWEIQFSQGAWPYTADLKNAAGERVSTVASLATAAGHTLPFQIYLSARASGGAPQNVLSLNPADVDALRSLATQLSEQKQPKEAAAHWRSITEIVPSDGAAWAALGETSYASEAFDDASNALTRAAALGVKTPSTLELQGRLSIRQNDFSAALISIEEAIATAPTQQSLWLLRAECARALKLRPKEMESVEHAAALGDVPILWAKELVASYLAAGQTEKAIPYLRKSQAHLPSDAPGLVEYAAFWEGAHEPQEAELIWRKALAADAESEAAYLGLTANYTATKRFAEAGQLAGQGLAVLPKSLPLLLAKEQALESIGDLYGARRFLTQHTDSSTSLELLKRRAQSLPTSVSKFPAVPMLSNSCCSVTRMAKQIPPKSSSPPPPFWPR